MLLVFLLSETERTLVFGLDLDLAACATPPLSPHLENLAIAGSSNLISFLFARLQESRATGFDRYRMCSALDRLDYIPCT